MISRLPLVAKILAWFFLNLLLLAAAFAFLFQSQFPINLNWFLVDTSRERIDAARDLIIAELNDRPSEDWDAILHRFSEAYKVEFVLYQFDGTRLAGADLELPPEIEQQLAPGWAERRRRARAAAAESPPATREEGEARFRVWAPRSLVRAGDPPHYWLLLRARLEPPAEPRRVLLAAVSRNLSGGGLLFDIRPWIWLGLGAVCFSILFWLPFIRGITGSLGRMTLTTERIASGDFQARVSSRRNDELGALARSINEMAGRLEGFVQGQKRFLGDIAHELCTPLAKLRLSLDLLSQKQEQAEDPHLCSASEKAAQIATLVEELLAFSKELHASGAPSVTAVPLHELVKESLRREEIADESATLRIPGDLHVQADRGLLQRALGNILRNAARYGGKEPIEVEAREAGDTIQLSVCDSGPGVPEPELEKIFNAFYRTDPSRQSETGGAGLGLAIAKSCVEACQGQITARNRSTGGLEVRITLPKP